MYYSSGLMTARSQTYLVRTGYIKDELKQTEERKTPFGNTIFTCVLFLFINRIECLKSLAEMRF